MCRSSFRYAFLGALILQCGLVTAANADTTRWGDGAGGGAAGSFEITYEKRLFEPGPQEQYCKRCANYLEVRLEIDDTDLADGTNADVTALAVGYRRYMFPFRVAPERQADHWRRNASAVFAGTGIGAYDVEPDDRRDSELFAGWYARAGLLIPLTHSCRREEDGTKSFRSWYLDATLSGTYNKIETPGENLDYTSVRVGLRINFPSSRDRARAEYLIDTWEKSGDDAQNREGIKDPCPGR